MKNEIAYMYVIQIEKQNKVNLEIFKYHNNI